MKCPGKPKDNVRSMGCCLGLGVGNVGWRVGANGLRASFWSPQVTGMSYNRRLHLEVDCTQCPWHVHLRYLNHRSTNLFLKSYWESQEIKRWSQFSGIPMDWILLRKQLTWQRLLPENWNYIKQKTMEMTVLKTQWLELKTQQLGLQVDFMEWKQRGCASRSPWGVSGWTHRWQKTHRESLGYGRMGLSRWLSGKASTCQCRRHRRHGFNPWVRKISWRRKWQPTPVFFPGKSHRQRSLVGYSPWGHKELDTTEPTWTLLWEDEGSWLGMWGMGRMPSKCLS